MVERCSLRSYAAVVNNRRIRGREREFLFVLCRWANDVGVCYPRVELIAKYFNCDERTVQLTQNKLEAKGELEIDHEASPLGTNILRICCVGGPALEKRGVKRTGVKKRKSQISPK